MTIDDLEFYLVEIERNELDRPVRSLLVRLSSESGLEGWGEAACGWHSGELPRRRELLRPVLGGRNAFDIEELLTLERLRSAPLRCAVEMASWDLVGRAVGQPLCHLFGGQYRRRIPVAVRLSGSQPDCVAEVAHALAEQGFHTQIVTSCGRPEEDLKTMLAVRARVGDRTELCFDAAAGYDLQSARDLCAELEFQNLKFLLDPLNTRELYPVAALARQTSVPLAVWRAIGGPADVLAAFRCGAAPLVVVDLERVGGLSAARKCAAVAEAAGMGALLGGGPSLGVGTAAMLQLAASTPAFSSCNECAFHQLQDHVLAEPLEIIDGMMAVPQAPGLGVEVDRGKVERYQVT
jgi:L-alanine-DL-glutamate epimerase-like enolase superfamily enzyme